MVAVFFLHLRERLKEPVRKRGLTCGNTVPHPVVMGAVIAQFHQVTHPGNEGVRGHLVEGCYSLAQLLVTQFLIYAGQGSHGCGFESEPGRRVFI